MNLFIPYSSEGSSTSILGGDRTDWIFYGQLKSTWCKWSQNLCFPQHLTSFHPIWCIGLVFFFNNELNHHETETAKTDRNNDHIV